MSPRKPNPNAPKKQNYGPPRKDGTPIGSQRPLVPMNQAPGLRRVAAKRRRYEEKSRVKKAYVGPDGVVVDTKGRPAAPGRYPKRGGDPFGDTPEGRALVDPQYGYNFNNMTGDNQFYSTPINKFTATVDAPELVERINLMLYNRRACRNPKERNKNQIVTAQQLRTWADEFKAICLEIRKLYPSNFTAAEFAVLSKGTKYAMHSWLFESGVPWTEPIKAAAHLRCLCRHRIIPLMQKQKRTNFPVFTLPDTAEPDEFLQRDPTTDLDMLLQNVLLREEVDVGEYIEESSRELVLPPEPGEEKSVAGVDGVPDMNKLFVRRRPGKGD